MSSLVPNARDPLFDPTSGQLTEIGRILVRRLAELTGDVAPLDGTYWVSRSAAVLTAERNLGALTAGYLKIAVALGTATPSTVTTIPQADITGLAASLAAATFNGVLNALLDLSGASAGQVKFPATQNPSANVNTLDDYEEGTWTPVDASVAGLSLTVTNATYTKVGRLVFVRAHVVYPATASGAAALVGGLPFTVAMVGACAISSNSATALQVGEFAATTTSMQPFGTASATVITNANLSGSFVVFSGCYEV